MPKRVNIKPRRLKMHVKKGDKVKVLAGVDKGKVGEVIRVYPERAQVLVQGVNVVWKHLRRSAEHPHGARIQKENPIPASRVMVVCAQCKKPTRIKRIRLPEGGKVRVCRKCNQPVSEEE
jgi:large subunit ribosomal protein L24